MPIPDERYARDPYILEEEVKSELCLPIFRQDELNTILYLENKISSNVFTPARIELLRMLSSQIGISLENASLYENLEAKVEERTREIVKQKEATGRSTRKPEIYAEQIGRIRKNGFSGTINRRDLRMKSIILLISSNPI